MEKFYFLIGVVVMFKPVKLYSYNLCVLLYVNYASFFFFKVLEEKDFCGHSVENAQRGIEDWLGVIVTMQ